MGIIQPYVPNLRDLKSKIMDYRPCCLQEAKDKDLMLKYIDMFPNILDRSNELVHFTASSWIHNPEKTKILMIYHNIYNAWAWTGGHADGEADLCTVALREAYEETGVFIPRYEDEIFSIEALTVDGHMKNGGWVASHIHLNITYAFEADDNMPLTLNTNETSGVQWVPIEQSVMISNEPEMQPIYDKLNRKLFGHSMF